MDNVFHECMSERGQGGTRHFQRSDKRHPYRPSIIELMEPSDPTQPRLPKYWQPWHCPDCNQFVLELVNPNPVDGRHESTENKAAVNEQDDLKVGLSPGEADSVANALEAKDKRIAELGKEIDEAKFIICGLLYGPYTCEAERRGYKFLAAAAKENDV